MKGQSFGNPKRGVSTLEILIAFAVLALSMSAVVIVIFSNQTVSADTQTNVEALSKAQAGLEQARSLSRQSYNLVVSVASTTDDIYQKALVVEDVTQCKKQATDTVSWSIGVRTLTVALTTVLTDVVGALALGGDCGSTPPTGGWIPPVLYASSNFNPGKPTALDVLDRVAYVGGDKEPYLYIADARAATLGQSSGLFVSFANLFNSTGKTIDQIVDIDVFRDAGSGKVYALAALASTTAQFAVIDVTDINNPTLVAKRGLAGVNPAPATSRGYRVFYYDKRGYIVTQETSGPEFHIFDLTNPLNPVELGTGAQLTGGVGANGTTVNDFIIRSGIGYFAVSKNGSELLVYNVSNPSAITHMPGASRDFPGNDNGKSLYLLGNKLYLGRESNSGPEVYILDASNPAGSVGGLPILKQQEIGSDVAHMRVAPPFAFLAVSQASGEFQVWPAGFTGPAVTIFNFPNAISGGIDFDSGWVFVASMANDSLQIFYSP